MSNFGKWLVLAAMTVMWLGSAACISYPNCENDDHCSEKGEYCLNGKCAQCRLDTHCGKGRRCVAGACEKIPGFCESVSDCVGKEKCRDNQCGDECLSDAECTDGKRCRNGECLSGVCSTDADCTDGQACRDGQCVAGAAQNSGGGPCDALEPVYFDFDESTLRADSRSTLQKHADCIKTKGRSLQVEGHCDDRGTEEYNLALGERRARTTRDYMVKLGAARGRLKTISYGESKPAKYGNTESVFQLNRRCEFKWQ